MTVTPTQLRANLYKILDQIIETEQSIEIRCKGKLLRLVVSPQMNRGKLANLKPHPGTLRTDPESFVQMDWTSSWGNGISY